MKDLLTNQHDFVKEKNFTGKFVEETTEGFLFLDHEDKKFIIPATKHTIEAVKKIASGDVVMFESTAKGFDAYLLEAGEIEIWKTKK